MPEILQIQAEPAHYAMKSPFESARRRSTTAENVLVKAVLSNGITGYGEASPASYVTGESPETVLAAVPALGAALAGSEVERVRLWSDRLRGLPDARPTVRSGIEMALLDGLARSWGVPLWTYFGGARTEVRTDLSIPLAAPEQAGCLAAEASTQGYRSLKIKVGSRSREEDLERALAVARAAPGARIRLDANQAFDADEALAFVGACLERGVPVELLEQPVPRDDWDALAAVTRHSPVPVIADEAVVDAAAALRVAATGAAHGINIKLAKAGLLGALDIIAIARGAGLKLMLGCMLESLLGIGAALHLACGTGAFDFLDLDSHALIGLRPDGRPFAQTGDLLQVDPAAPGIGWAPPG